MNFDFISTAKRKPKTRYNKPESIKQLELLYFDAKKALHPGISVSCLPLTKFRDDSANGLTKCIIAWLKLHGCFAARINTTGTYNQKLGKYIRSGSRRGMADITSIINGKHVSIEVKIGRDRMRPDQLKVKSEVEAAGGIYIVATSFDNFLSQIKSFQK